MDKHASSQNTIWTQYEANTTQETDKPKISNPASSWGLDTEHEEQMQTLLQATVESHSK